MGIFRKGRSLPPGFMDLSKMDPSKSPEPSLQLQPLTSPAYENVPMWSILPLYQLYESTFSKNVHPQAEEIAADPPTYEVASPHLSGSDSGGDYFSRGTNNAPSENAGRALLWENTILGNTHRLKHLASFNKSLADQVKVDITMTKLPGEKGKKPDAYSPLGLEYLQGDSVHGYVTVRNIHLRPIPFDMFSVLLEGRVSVTGDVNEGKKPIVFHKFLNMFDYNASWTPAYFDEGGEPVDPVDGSYLSFPLKKELAPGRTYKKFFNFTLPDKLLDCACEQHEIPNHCQVLPSIGLDKDIFLQRLRKLREKPVKDVASPVPQGKPLGIITAGKRPSADDVRLWDFSFPDTCISYCVEARLVGKFSDYARNPSPSEDEFIIVKEGFSSLRVVPRAAEMPSPEEEEISRKQFEVFRKDVERCVKRGNELQSGQPSAVRRPSTSKQTYGTSNAVSQKNQDAYEVFLPYQKKSLTQAPKVLGMISASVPKKKHVVGYVSPRMMVSFSEHSNKSTIITVPLTLNFVSGDAQKSARPPEISKITAELVASTIRSKKYPIPVELNQEMTFQNRPVANDNIERYVIEPFRKHLDDLVRLVEKFGAPALDVNLQMIMDVKSLAHLQHKASSLKFEQVNTKSDGGLLGWKETLRGHFSKDVEVSVDLKTLFKMKTLLEDGALCLVPSFQSCIICRYYYLSVRVRFANGDGLLVKVPVKIVK